MPSKIQLDENLWFLYICIQKSDLKTIDFAAVGASTNLKPPAARMRYTRLRRQIESGTLIGTHGQPFAGSADKISEASAKRKRRDSSSTPNQTETASGPGIKAQSETEVDGDETEEEVMADDEIAGSYGYAGGVGHIGAGVGTRVRAGGDESTRGGKALLKHSNKKSPSTPQTKRPKIKTEPLVQRTFSRSSSSSHPSDSEDEIPLAKLQKARLGTPFRSPVGGKTYPGSYTSRREAAQQMMTPMEVPRTMAGLELGGGLGREMGEQKDSFGNPFVFGERSRGREENYVLASGNGDLGVSASTVGRGWDEGDWARWQNRFGVGQAARASPTE